MISTVKWRKGTCIINTFNIQRTHDLHTIVNVQSFTSTDKQHDVEHGNPYCPTAASNHGVNQ